MKKTRMLCSIILVAAMWTTPSLAQHESEEKAVLKVVQSLFDAMAEADSAKAANLFLKDGHSYRVQNQGQNEEDIRLSPHRSFINSIGSWEQKIVERMWDARVLVEDGIAMVWTPYDLYADGAFSHCGIDLLSLIKTGEGWKIADITYTVKQEGCEESPLGPPEQ